MKRRLHFVLAVIALLVAMALPVLPAITSTDTPAGHAAGVVYASGDPTPTPTLPSPNGECTDSGNCGG